jgi:hypothetical protein
MSNSHVPNVVLNLPDFTRSTLFLELCEISLCYRPSGPCVQLTIGQFMKLRAILHAAKGDARRFVEDELGKIYQAVMKESQDWRRQNCVPHFTRDDVFISMNRLLKNYVGKIPVVEEKKSYFFPWIVTVKFDDGYSCGKTFSYFSKTHGKPGDFAVVKSPNTGLSMPRVVDCFRTISNPTLADGVTKPVIAIIDLTEYNEWEKSYLEVKKLKHELAAEINRVKATLIRETAIKLSPLAQELQSKLAALGH